MFTFVRSSLSRLRAPLSLSLCTVGALAAAPAARAQWAAQTSRTTVELRGLSVLSSTVAWASGIRGTVLHTMDGGTTWTADTVPGASRLDFRAVAATSPLVAHVLSIGDSSRFYRTTDGGKSWSLRYVSARKGSFFDAIKFWDARHGIAVSDPVNGHVLLAATDDGGESWHELPAESSPVALPGDGFFAASGSCLTVYGTSDVWLVSGGASVARVFHSADRGRTWSAHDTPIRAGTASAGGFSVVFRDALHGAVAGGDYQKPALSGRNLAVTGDGGVTWTLTDSATSPAGFRSAVDFLPGRGGWSLVAVGLTGTDVSLDAGVTWTPVDSVPYNSVVFEPSGAGWAVGPKGRIARWTGGGRDARLRSSPGAQ
jgi:photosystem II stability/assembly factor-like uncharacterized protein